MGRIGRLINLHLYANTVSRGRLLLLAGKLVKFCRIHSNIGDIFLFTSFIITILAVHVLVS